MKNIIIVLISFFLVQFYNSSAQNITREITLDDIYHSGKFYPKYIYGIRPLNDGNQYLSVENNSINIYSYKSGDIIGTLVSDDQLIPEGDSVPISIRQYNLSNDEKKILFATETESIYRHSNKSNFFIYDLELKKLTMLSDKGKQRLATFSPDGNNVAFVRDNNIYIKDLIKNLEYQITFDGLYNNIIYGTTDWVYEEEFGFTKAFFWSPDGSKIAYYRFDESNVKEYELTKWGDLYPEHIKYKYPKAGEDNSLVNIFVYDLDSKQISEMNIGEETDIYIPRIKWTNDPGKLSILWMNRLQNELKILLADANTGNTKAIYLETNKYYIDITDNLTFLKDNKRFIFSSEKDGYNHLYLYDLSGNLLQQITNGEWDITEFIGLDETKGLVYYISSESSPMNRELYVINLDGIGKKKLSKKDGNNNVQFGKQFKYYINTYSDANTPLYVTVNSSKGKLIRVLEDNNELNETISEYNLGHVKKLGSNL